MTTHEPAPRWGHAAVGIGGRVYMWGGENKDGKPFPASQVEVFDINTGLWEQKITHGPTPTGVIYGGYTVIGNALYTFAGRGEGRTYFNDLHKLDLNSMGWTKLHPKNPENGPPEMRGCGMVANGKDSLVVFSGYTGTNQYTNNLYKYSLSTGTWSVPKVAGDIPGQCGYITFINIDKQRALVYGGVTKERRRVSDVYILDMYDWRWTKLIPAAVTPPGRSGHAACYIGGPLLGTQRPQLMVMGGLDDSFGVQTDAWVLDVQSSKWTQLQLPDDLGCRCDQTLTVVTRTSTILQLLLFGGEKEWAKDPLAASTLVQMDLESEEETHTWRITDVAATTDPARWNETILHLQNLAKVRTVVKQKKTIHTKATSLMFIGPPRVGKTTLIQRLLRDSSFVVSPFLPSTAIAEGPLRIAIKKVSPQMAAKIGTKWSIHVQDFMEEKLHLVKHTLRQLAITVPKSGMHHPENETSSGHQQIQTVLVSQKREPTRRRSRWRLFGRGNTRHRNLKQPTSEPEEKLTVTKQNPLPFTFETPDEIITEALTGGRLGEVEELLEDSIMLHVLDTGGQPEFLEVLAALLMGPSINLLVFKLNEALEERYVVEYIAPDGSKTTPYVSSFTIEEVLFQALASVSFTTPPVPSSLASLHTRNAVSNAMTVFVGTHKDLATDEQFEVIDNTLSRKLNGTVHPKTEVIHYPTTATPELDPSYRMVVAVDNTKADDPGLAQLQEMLTKILQKLNQGAETPLAWLMLHLSLRSIKVQVLSFEKCRTIAKTCGIDNDDELKLALWFLSHECGIFRYYPEVKGLEDLVICDIQVLFDLITNLITSTFEMRQMHTDVEVRFRQTGRCPVSEAQKLLNDTGEIPFDKLIKLLEHLHILCVISNENSEIEEFFFPCILRPYPVEIWKRCTPLLAPLLITFDCGYCPLGLFSALIVHMASSHLQSELRWQVNNYDGKLFRNLVAFLVGEDCDKVVFIARPTFYEVWIEKNQEENISLHELCSQIRTVTDNALRKVKASHSSYRNIGHHIAFYCQNCDGSLHPATPNLKDSTVSPTNAICFFTKQPSPLLPNQRVWYGKAPGEQTYFPPEATLKVKEAFEFIDNNPLGEDSLATLLAELEEATDWYKLGIALGLKPSRLHDIKIENREDLKACRMRMICAWLRMNDHVVKASWRALAVALVDPLVNYTEIARIIVRKYSI